MLHAGKNRVGSATDFTRPARIVRADPQDAVRKLDRGHPCERRAHGELPRERRPLFGRPLAADDFRKHARRELLDGYHSEGAGAGCAAYG